MVFVSQFPFPFYVCSFHFYFYPTHVMLTSCDLCLCLSIINGTTLLYWEHWHDVMESEKRAGEIMSGCLARISRLWLSRGWNGWMEVVKFEKQSASQAEVESLMEKLQREKMERAGRKMRFCLNQISNAAFVGSFVKWKAVMAAWQKR